jgi:hypothetical protein
VLIAVMGLTIVCSLVVLPWPSGETTRLLRALEAEEPRDRAIAQVELRRLGTNMLPQLLRMAAERRSVLHDGLANLLERLGLRGFGICSAVESRTLAVEGFRVLREQASPAAPALATMLSNSETAGDAALCLIPIGEAAVPILIAAMTNRNPIVRSRSAAALGAINPKDDEPAKALIAALRDEVSTVRSCAAWSLGSLKPEPSVVLPELINLLRDSSATVRHHAVRAIGAFERNATIASNALSLMAKDPEEEVRIAASAALVKIRGDELDAKGAK